MKTKLSGIMTLLLAFMVQITFAQDRTITGTVSDETGALPGASVLIEGTSTGTETDFDGKFTINAKNGDVLRFSFVGMGTASRTVGTDNVINVTLVADKNILEEVVVMGYGTRKKSELTGSSVQLKSQELEQVPVASVDQVLQGKVAGLTISGTSGTPGSTQNIRIRGISSITAGNEPLYVIDGVPVINANASGSTAISSLSTLSSINPNSIASITVLKDASATAAYGARGANGVIVITTKGGQSGKTKFNFSSSVGFSNDAVDGPTMLKASEQEELYYEALFNTYGADYGFGRDGAQQFYLDNPGAFGDDWTVWNNNGRLEGNWADVITNDNALQTDYNFSATGGDEISNFYVAFGIYDAEATVIGAEYKRYSGSLNYSRDLNDNFKFDTKNSVSNIDQEGILENSAYFASPRVAKYFMTPRAQPYNADGTINIDDIRSATSVRNPLWISKYDKRSNNLTRLLSNNTVTWQTPIENLSVTSRFGIDYQVSKYDQYWNRTHGDGQSSGGAAYQEINTRTNFVVQNTLDYRFTLGENHNFNLKGVQEFQQNEFSGVSADGENFAADGLELVGSTGTNTGSSFYSDWKIASYTGLFNYTFNSRFVLNGTIRTEGNSRFPSENRWGNFWSVGAAWNLHNEDFMDGSSDFLSNLKLRASYGVTGNAEIGLNEYQALLSFDADYGGAAASYPSVFGNKDLTWETSNSLDVGIDYGFWENRITGSFSYYNRESSDLLLSVPLSRTTSFPDQYRNIGTMENSGIEFDLNFDVVRSEDFNLSVGGYFSTNDNEVKEMPKDPNGNTIPITTGTRRVDEGHTVYEWYMVTWAGVDPDTGDNLYYTDGEGSATTANFTEANRVYQKSGALPTLTAGLNFNVDFKGFFLNATGYYASGHKVYEDWTRYIHQTDRYNFEWFNSINTLNDRWQEPGDITNVPKVTYSVEPWRTHSKFLHDGDYFRLKNITFGYDLKPEFAEQIGLESVRMFVRGINMYTWVKDDNLLYDPEVEADGFAGLTTPPAKTISLGININF